MIVTTILVVHLRKVSGRRVLFKEMLCGVVILGDMP